MKLSKFHETKLNDVIEWSEPEAGTLVHRYPMLDMEIQTGAKLVVREGERAAFVDGGRVADVLGAGAYALTAANLPVLASVKHWAKEFAGAFRSDVYFFATRGVTDQRWGTCMPVALCDDELGSIQVRGYGSYAYRIADVRRFFAQVSGARESYFVYDLDDRLRHAIVACMADVLAATGLLGADMTANAAALNGILLEEIEPVFAELGLELTQFSVEAVSLRDELDQSATGCGCCGAPMRVDDGVLKCDSCHNVVAVDAGGDAAAEFACPGCEIALMQATVGGASLLYCTRCDGMLVALEEFEALVAAARALPGGTVPVAAAESRDTFDCPECKRAMGVSFYGGDVAIDSCEDCGLNWLDHGELARIACAPVVEAGSYFDAVRGNTSAGLNLSV